MTLLLKFTRDIDGDYHADRDGIVYNITKSTSGFGISIHGLSTAERDELKNFSRDAVWLNSISWRGTKHACEALADDIANAVANIRQRAEHKAFDKWLETVRAVSKNDEDIAFMRQVFVAGYAAAPDNAPSYISSDPKRLRDLWSV